MVLSKIKVMTAEEVANFKKKVYGAGSEKKQLSADYCAKNINDLIRKHEEYYLIHLEKKYNKYKEQYDSSISLSIDNNNIINDVKNNLHTHYCICGAELNYIKNYNFVGCTDYRNEDYRHTSYNYKAVTELQSFHQFCNDYTWSKTYLNDFRNHYGITFIMASVLYEFLFEVYGQECYAIELKSNTFQTGVNASKQSKKEEFIVKSICNELFDIVSDQVHFSLEIDGKYSVRIPDLICSNESKVVVFDIKKNNNIVDLLKLNLYQDIVTQVCKDRNDYRIVESYHIVYDKKAYTDHTTRTITINDLKPKFK
jgi:hypothetical protein